MNGIIEGKSIEKTIPDIVTKDFVIFVDHDEESKSIALYSSYYPEDYYALCIAPARTSTGLANIRPNAYGLYHINRKNKSIKNIWYDANKDYNASQYSPSRYTFFVDEDYGNITAQWYSDSGRSGREIITIIGFSN